jgi:flagellar hook-associated protein 3 FlgL
MDQQEGLSRTQEQLATGRRVLSPSDDPVAATQILALQKNVDITTQYQDNITYIKNRLGIEDELINSATNVVQRVRELTVQAANITNSDKDRQAIAQEVQQRLEELMGIANTKDPNGEYIFGGYKGEIPPVTYDTVTETFTYRGDQGVRDIQVGPDYYIQQTNNGDELFMRVRNGNETFVTDYGAANTGTGVIDSGVVTDPTLITNHDYEIQFYDPIIPGDPVEYSVLDVTTGDYVIGGPPLLAPNDVPQVWTDGQAIQFDGIEVTIAGEPDGGAWLPGPPVPGDTFTVAPSSSQDIFTTMQDLINTLNRPRSSHADSVQIDMDHGVALQELDNGLNQMLGIRAGLGARVNSAESQESVNSGYELYLQKNLSELQDLDYAEATSRLNLQLVGMQAAQQVYQKVQGLTLFNYIR